MQFGAVASIALSFLVVVFYFIRLITIKDLKSKYDFVNQNEINYLMIGGYLVVIAGWFFLNSLFGDRVQVEAGIFIARLLGTLIFASIFFVVVYNVLKIYYPSFLEKKLHKLRYTPRVSPDGNNMKLLSEEEEDVYLSEGMQAEEDVFSVDYDVWIDEKTNFTKIEKYDGHLHAEKCDNCNFQTLKVIKEEILTSPTSSEKGELMKYYECTYCGHKDRKLFNIGRIKIAEETEKSTV
jgi:hypothetical protein